MVEQLTLNQRVGGSSPPRFTKSFNDLRNFCRMPLLLNVAGTVAGQCILAI